jgi:hypothetical protein
MQYKVIRLIEMDGRAVLEAQDPGLLAFSSLMKRPEDMDTTQWLDECVQVVGSSSVGPREQLVALGILSSLIYDTEVIKQRIPEGLMQEFPLIQEFVDEAETRGREEGERNATIESILALLSTRFNPDAVQILRPALETVDDLSRLKESLLVAPYAESLEAFMQTLRQ